MKVAALATLGAVALMTAGIIAAIGVVWVYSTFVSPGRAFVEYQAFAQVASPWVAVVTALPLSFWVSRVLARRVNSDAQGKAVWGMIGIHLVLEGFILAGSSPAALIWGFAACSAGLRICGAWMALRYLRAALPRSN